MDLRTDEIRKLDAIEKNYELLEELDTLLDDVDGVLLKMELPKEIKQRLTEYSYKVFMEAEAAIIEMDKLYYNN